MHPISLSDDLDHPISISAEVAGLSVERSVADHLPARRAAEAKTKQFFAARAARAQPGRGLKILEQAGIGNPPLPGDGFDE